MGYSSDNTSNVVGEFNSLWSRIRDEAPDCVQIRCTCHSLALCIKEAFDQLLSHIGLLLSSVPKGSPRVP